MYAHEFNYDLLFQKESDRLHGPGATSIGPGPTLDSTRQIGERGPGPVFLHSQLVDRLDLLPTPYWSTRSEPTGEILSIDLFVLDRVQDRDEAAAEEGVQEEAEWDRVAPRCPRGM